MNIAQPEIWFRIIHLAWDGHHGSPVAPYRERTVEVALGPNGAFENGGVRALTRRVTADRVVNAAARARRSAKSPPQPRIPRVVELLRKAREWRRQLDAGEVATQAEIARREGITRARVTQIMGLLRLAPDVQRRILSLPKVAGRAQMTERQLRSMTASYDQTTIAGPCRQETPCPIRTPTSNPKASSSSCSVSY